MASRIRPERVRGERPSALFTFSGAVDGARRNAPVALSVFAYGAVFGVLARQAGLTLAEATLMSGLVCAGSSQFVALDLWREPLPVAAIALTALVVNLRYLLMGAALAPHLSGLPAHKAYASVFFMGDENWALTAREFAAGKRDAAFLLGSGLALFAAWVGGTAAGHALGVVAHDPARWGLDFAFTAAFVALLVGMGRGGSDALPWAVAGAASVASSYLLPGKWHIIFGGVAGSVVGALRDAR